MPSYTPEILDNATSLESTIPFSFNEHLVKAMHDIGATIVHRLAEERNSSNGSTLRATTNLLGVTGMSPGSIAARNQDAENIANLCAKELQAFQERNNQDQSEQTSRDQEVHAIQHLMVAAKTMLANISTGARIPLTGARLPVAINDSEFARKFTTTIDQYIQLLDLHVQRVTAAEDALIAATLAEFEAAEAAELPHAEQLYRNLCLENEEIARQELTSQAKSALESLPSSVTNTKAASATAKASDDAVEATIHQDVASLIEEYRQRLTPGCADAILENYIKSRADFETQQRDLNKLKASLNIFAGANTSAKPIRTAASHNFMRNNFATTAAAQSKTQQAEQRQEQAHPLRGNGVAARRK